MSTNGHSFKFQLVKILADSGGKVLMSELTADYKFKKRQIDDVLEMAHSPIRLKLGERKNGNGYPATYVALKAEPEPPAKPRTQAEAARNLNQMSPEEYR